MNSGIREMRFTSVASRELRSGSRRQPTWQQALLNAGNELSRAQHLYVERRVAFMIKEERSFGQWQQDFTALGTFKNTSGRATRMLLLFGASVILGMILVPSVFRLFHR